MSKPMDRWVVRTRAGKLYGPLGTDRIIKKIHEGFFRGEEWVAVYPNGQWQIISKHPEFYDAFLEALNFSSGRRDREEPSVPPEMEDAESEAQSSRVDKELEGAESERADPDRAGARQKALESGEDDEPTRGEDLRLDEPPREHTKSSSRKNDSRDRTKTRTASRSKSQGEVIQLEKVANIQKKVRRRNLGKNAAILAVALLVFLVLLLFLHTPSGDRVRLLRPNGIGLRTLSPEELERKWIQALNEFRLDTFQNYMNAQNRLVELVEGEQRPMRALELLCMTYHNLWSFAQKNPADMETIQYAARSAAQLDPTSRATDVCRAVELVMLGSYQEAEEHLQGVLRTHPEYVFINSLYAELKAANQDFETAAYYYNQAGELWGGKTVWLAIPYHEADARSRIQGVASNAEKAKAMDLLDRVIRANPYHASAWIQKGLLEHRHFKQSDRAKDTILNGVNAEQRISRALLSDAYLALAEMENSRRNTEQALVYAKEAYRANFRNSEAKRLLAALGGDVRISESEFKKMDLLYLGDQYVRAGDCFAAQAEFKAAFEADPKNGLAAMKAAQCLWRLNQSDEAIEWLRRSVQATPELLEAYLRLSDYYSQRFDYMAAVRVLQAAVDHSPRSYKILRGFALIELRKKNYKGAAEFAQQTLAIYDADVEALMILARAQRGLGMYNEAYKNVSKAIEMDKNNLEAHQLYALLLADLKGSATGLHYLKKWLEIYPEEIEYQLTMGEIYLTQGHLDDAEKVYREVLLHQPENKRAAIQLGRIYQRQNQFQESLEHYLQAAALDPSDVEPLYLAGHLYLDFGRPAQALEQFERAALMNKRYPLVFYSIAKAALAMKDYERAQQAVEVEKEQNPKLAEPFLLAAEIQQAQQHYSQCVQEYQRGIANGAQSAGVYIGLARCFRQSGALDSAMSMLKQAAMQESGHPDIYKEQGAIYQMKGQAAEAIDAFQRYLALAPNASDRGVIERQIQSLQMPR